MNEINKTLSERGSRYGNFSDHARISQNMKDILRDLQQYYDMTLNKREAIEMIIHKIARIVNGDPNYRDSWVDIAGYAMLVADTLEEKQCK